MKKFLSVIPLLVLFLCGCSTYKYQLGTAPYDKGYVVTRDNKVIPEYTIGKDKTVPDKKIAEERFKRRRKKVEYCYKKMGYMESRGKEMFWDTPAAFFKLIAGFFRLPFIAVSEYKYDHNPAYREKVKRIEEQKDACEQARINGLKTELAFYVQQDLLTKEGGLPLESMPAAKLTEAQTPVMPQKEVVTASLPEKTIDLPAAGIKQEEVLISQEAQAQKAMPKPKVKAKPKPKQKAVAKKNQEPVAIIIARPAKGFSPLTVRFSGTRSYSRGSRIIHYSWDFGDGDTSTKPNPVNTFYSGSFMPQAFTITLTVQDKMGNTATTTTAIEVMNK